MGEHNYWAILVAALSAFLLGGPWYSNAMFGKAWRKHANDTRPPGDGHPAKIFGLSFLFSLIAAAAFAYGVGATPELVHAVGCGLFVGGCFVATSFGINYQFANRSAVMLLIDGGFHIAQFTLFGLVLGLWH
jgi:hypothetical protein